MSTLKEVITKESKVAMQKLIMHLARGKQLMFAPFFYISKTTFY